MPSDALTHAELSCLDDMSMSIVVQFNPTSFKLGRRVSWAEQPAALQPWSTLQYGSGGSDNMQVTLLMDDSESVASVLPNMEGFYRFTLPIRVSAEVIRPPVLLFRWEEFRFLGVVQSIDIDVLLFDESGSPKRATVALSLIGRAFAAAVSADEFFTQTYEP